MLSWLPPSCCNMVQNSCRQERHTHTNTRVTGTSRRVERMRKISQNALFMLTHIAHIAHYARSKLSIHVASRVNRSRDSMASIATCWMPLQAPSPEGYHVLHDLAWERSIRACGFGLMANVSHQQPTQKLGFDLLIKIEPEKYSIFPRKGFTHIRKNKKHPKQNHGKHMIRQCTINVSFWKIVLLDWAGKSLSGACHSFRNINMRSVHIILLYYVIMSYI